MITRAAKRLVIIVLAITILGVYSINVQAAAPRNVVVFLGGLCTTLKDGFGVSPNFSTLQSYLKLSTYGYTANDLLAYSYRGGRMQLNNGKYRWYHFAYSDLTPIDQPYTTSLQQLDGMLKAYKLRYPEAKFILVGHSFGGFLAMEYITTYGSDLISKVITVDSPLQGSPLQIIDPANWVLQVAAPCMTGQPGNSNMTILTNRYKFYPYYATWFYSPAITRAKAAGVQFYTTGNMYDGLYNPSYCAIPTALTGPGNTAVQWLPDTINQTFIYTTTSIWRTCLEYTHGAATSQASAAYTLAADIGHR